MLVIRFQRTGRENIPTYRLVVAEKARPVKGKVLEVLGHYLPAREPAVLELREDRITFWVQRGAALSDTAARTLTKAGMKGLEKHIQPYTKKKPKVTEATQENVAPAAPKAENAPAA
jgi:small subunit ribosomal protein S16